MAWYVAMPSTTRLAGAAIKAPLVSSRQLRLAIFTLSFNQADIAHVYRLLVNFREAIR